MRKLLIIVIVLVIVLAAFVVVIPRINPPKPQTHTFHVFGGDVARTWISDSNSDSSRPGTFTPPILPHHLEYTSSHGEIDLFVVKLDGSPADQIAKMTQLTTDLKSGRDPEPVVARATGRDGQIQLHSWALGTVKYLLLVRSEQDSDISVIVHYGR